MKILCLEQGDWIKPTEFPSNGRDWEARRYTDFDISPNRRARDTDYPINDENSPMKIANFNGVGGGTILFTAHYPRLHPSDFRGFRPLSLSYYRRRSAPVRRTPRKMSADSRAAFRAPAPRRFSPGIPRAPNEIRSHRRPALPQMRSRWIFGNASNGRDRRPWACRRPRTEQHHRGSFPSVKSVADRWRA
jgi:choline dehydrogenase-like flavoprotein